jgi:hypothetical protein
MQLQVLGVQGEGENGETNGYQYFHFKQGLIRRSKIMFFLFVIHAAGKSARMIVGIE